MKRFYYVTFSLMILVLLILCVNAPWTQPESNSPNLHQTIGYAPVWSNTYAQIPDAHVDWNGAFAAYAGAIVFFFDCSGRDRVFLQRKTRKASHSPNKVQLSAYALKIANRTLLCGALIVATERGHVPHCGSA